MDDFGAGPAPGPFSFPSPFSVSSSDRDRITPRNLATSGVLPGNTVIQIGTSNIKIDGANRRIIISDGTTDRIIIGFLSGGF